MTVFNSTTIDPRFILASDLQGLFRDKLTGLPLRAGYISTFSENDHITQKSLWLLSGSPGAYTYTQLQNPLPLTAIGTYSDGASDDIIPYWFPYEGLPDDNLTTVELYFVQVYANNNTFQFSRIAWPNFSIASSGTTSTEIVNFIPNGQFLSHNNLPATTIGTIYKAGQIRMPNTNIAQGGWVFRQPIGSTATDIVTFFQYAWVNNPTGNPKFAVEISNQGGGGGDLFKDLCIDFRDVNKFSSDPGAPILYTISFTGYTTISSISVDLYLKKNFGTGGTPSSATESKLTTFVLTTAIQIFSFTFTFGSNTGKNVGSNGDDYVELALRFPIGSSFTNGLLTDFALNPGTVVVTAFADETNADMLTRGVAGWMPTPAADGSDLYLPLRLTAAGLEFDHTEIGKVYPVTYPLAGVGELLCDGSAYKVSEYSSDGIPYSRLFNKINNIAYNIPPFGTGLTFSTSYISSLTTPAQNFFRLTNNSAGIVSDTVDVNTGFTIVKNHTATAAGIGLTAYVYAATSVLYQITAVNPAGHAVDPPVDGSSPTGFTFTTIRDGDNEQAIFTITGITAASTLGSSNWFKFGTVPAASPAYSYYVWFSVDGAGTDPTPMGLTGIQINLQTEDTATEVAAMIREAMNQFEISTIKCTAASAITTGHYFLFFTASQDYYVWYRKDGSGADPAPSGKVGILVDILSADTNTQVASKSVIAFNKTYFAVPGPFSFIRAWNNGSGSDPDAATRFSLDSNYFGDLIGTFELDQLLSHLHNPYFDNFPNIAATGATSINSIQATITGSPAATTYTGGSENRPRNISLNYVIKY